MALIVCPECGKEISDKSETCIHCGFPIAKEIESSLQRKKQEKMQAWEKRNQAALQLPGHEAIPLFIELGNEGYLKGYVNAGITYDNMGDSKSAYDYLMKVYNLDPMSCEGLTAQALGYLHAKRYTSFFDSEKAILFLKESKTLMSYFRLGQIYNPCYVDDGFENHKNFKIALGYYKKLLDDKAFPHIATLYNDIGVIFGDYYNNAVIAASFCLLAKRLSNTQTICNNYETYIMKVRKKGAIWENNIQNIRVFEDIDPMIRRVNDEVKTSAVRSSVFPSNKVKKKNTKNRTNAIKYLLLIVLLSITIGFFVVFITGGFGKLSAPILIILFFILCISFTIASENEKSKRHISQYGKIAKCYHCGSTRVYRMNFDDKRASISFWGTASSKFGKTYHCDNCGREW